MRWSVIDRWPTHPKLVKVFAENIRKQLDTFDEKTRYSALAILSNDKRFSFKVMGVLVPGFWFKNAQVEFRSWLSWR